VRRRAVILVLDGVGVGAAPDAAEYADVGSDTLGNLARAVGGLRHALRGPVALGLAPESAPGGHAAAHPPHAPPPKPPHLHGCRPGGTASACREPPLDLFMESHFRRV